MSAVYGTADQFILETQGDEPDAALVTANAIAASPDVEWAQPDFLQEYVRSFIPNDPLFTQQWHLHNSGQGGGVTDADVDAPLAWDATRGDPSTVIAIIDDGVELNHPDLEANIAVNPFEIPGNRIDDDHNGLVDDVNGWDFADFDNNPNPSVNGLCDNADCHGQAVAGVAAAVGNNGIGVSGICPSCRILPIKIFKGGNFAGDSAVASAIRYAGTLADVLNNSWGSPPGSRSAPIESAIADVASAGRGGLGAPVVFSSGNSAEPPWITFELGGVPPGTVGYAFVYFKDGSSSAGDDAMRIDALQFPGESINGFENGALPPNCASGTTGAPIPWSVVTDSSRAFAGQRFLRSGAIGDGGTTILVCNRSSTSGGTLRFQGWISSEAGYDGFELYVSIGGTLIGPYLAVSGGVPTYIGQVGFPANQAGAWAVGATTNLGERARYSQFGTQLFLVAPSNGGTLAITTTDRSGTAGYDTGSYTSTFGGTSSAAPLASGVMGLVLSRQPTLTRNALQQVLQSSADKIGGLPYPAGRNDQFGWGRVNAAAAVALVGPTATVTPRPTPTLTATRTRTVTPTPTLTRSPTPTLTPTPLALPDPVKGKNATKCQEAIVKNAAKLVGASLKSAGDCVGALLRCAGTKAGDASCPGKAAAACMKKIGALSAATAKRRTALVDICATLGIGELRAVEGLGFEAIAGACAAGGGGVDGPQAIASCITREHGCRSDQMLGMQLPRASALMAEAGLGTLIASELACLSGPDGGAEGAGALAPSMERCAGAIRKAGRSLVLAELGGLGKCLTSLFACEQAKPGGFAPCVRKADPKCRKTIAGFSAARTKLVTAIQKACGALPFSALASASGLHLEALASECASRGVAVDSPNDYAECLIRHHECAVDALIRIEVPRADQLFARVGLEEAFPNVPCPGGEEGPSPTPSASPRPSTPSATQTLVAPTNTPAPVASATPTGADPTETASSTSTPTVSPSSTPTEPSETPTATVTPDATPSPTPSGELETPTVTSTATTTETPNPVETETATPAASVTETPSASPTSTTVETATPVETETSTPFPTPSTTETTMPSATPSVTVEPTTNPTPTAMLTATSASTDTPVETATPQETPTATETGDPSETPTIASTPTPMDTETPASGTPAPTETPS
ncbi:MAG: S8 family serine peptidase [Candidatus Binatia bacterium]